jgi:hypothetical protein
VILKREEAISQVKSGNFAYPNIFSRCLNNITRGRNVDISVAIRLAIEITGAYSSLKA